MGRVSSTRRKKQLTQIVLGIFFIGLLIVFLATVGLNIILGGASFVSNLSHKNTVEKEVSDDLVSAPEFTSIVTATNSATIQVTGYSNSKKSIALYVNGDKQKEVIPEDSEFTTELSLSGGTNEIYAEIEIDGQKETKRSTTHTVVYKNERLEITIESPQDGETTSKDEITIKGKVNSESEVKVNGAPAILDSNNAFSKIVRLQKGDNMITIDAKDAAGNRESKTVTVKFEPEE